VRHQRLIWTHSFDDEPVVLWSEIDDDGFERRKVDEYRHGRLDYADKGVSTGSTRLSDQPMPPLEQINADREFSGGRDFPVGLREHLDAGDRTLTAAFGLSDRAI
jgi:hypothetical protein